MRPIKRTAAPSLGLRRSSAEKYRKFPIVPHKTLDPSQETLDRRSGRRGVGLASNPRPTQSPEDALPPRALMPCLQARRGTSRTKRQPDNSGDGLAVLSAATRNCPVTATKVPAGGHEFCPVAVTGSARLWRCRATPCVVWAPSSGAMSGADALFTPEEGTP
jgi:hypothetical protein